MGNIFCERLKELRIEKALGQVELAKELNVSKGIISLWENGLREPKLSNLITLANFFEVSIDIVLNIIYNVSKFQTWGRMLVLRLVLFFGKSKGEKNDSCSYNPHFRNGTCCDGCFGYGNR